MPVSELLDDWFESDALKGAVGAGGVTNIMQGPRSGGTSFVLLHHQVGQPAGAIRSRTVAKGGAGRLTSALAASARALGVEIRVSATVGRINQDGEGRATGVSLTSGEEIAASRVVSAIDPRRTILGLLDAAHLDPELLRDVRNIKQRGVRAKVNLALSELPRFSGLGEADLKGAITIAPSLDYLERAYDDAKHGGVSDRPWLEARIPSLHETGLAPSSKHVMSVVVQYAPYAIAAGSWDAAQKRALQERVIATLGAHASNFAGSVIASQVVSPQDVEAEFGVSEGNGYHGELTLDQILFMRPVAGFAHYHGPVDGLWMCSAGTHPGGGITGMSGRLAARAILKART
jgi:phytoene dehydrogenase-like protein